MELTTEQKEVFTLTNQMQWHLKQIKNRNYELSDSSLNALKQAEEIMDKIVPYI